MAVELNVIDPYSTEIFHLNFLSLDVVSRYRDPQLQVTENVSASLLRVTFYYLFMVAHIHVCYWQIFLQSFETGIIDSIPTFK